MLIKVFLIIVISTLSLCSSLSSQVKKPVKSPRAKAVADSLAAAKDSINERLKGSTKIGGLFTLYQDTATGSLMMYVKKDQVGKEFIYQSFSMGGPASLFLNQNMIRDTWVFNIRKKFNKIEFSRANTNFYYDPKNPVSKAANVDVADAVFYSDKIVMKDSLGFYVNVDGLFLSDKLDRIKPNFPSTVPATAYLNLGQLNASKSNYKKVQSFPKNTDVTVELAYENPAPANEGGKDITDARYVTVKMQHTFIEMPVNDFRPRRDDPRVGYFTQEVDDMTSRSSLYYHDLIDRWNLVKKDPGAAISEPVEPVTWWVENTTPVELRQIIIDAGLKWNEAFEKAGFKNAVVMKMMPDTATWDPADIRYNVIRWVSSDLGYAIGPSFVNPRTGQILGADITIDYGFMNGLVAEQDLLEQRAHGMGQPIAVGKGSSSKNRFMNCSIGKGLSADYSMGKAVLDIYQSGPEQTDSLIKQFFTSLIMHEMGHTFGLNHNMKASQMLSPEELQKKDVTRSTGVVGSVMDYDAVNVSYDKSKQGDYYTTKTGPYDAWAISFGYTPFAENEEEQGLNKILSRSTEPKLIFGNDADIAGFGSGVDPRVMVWDMSNDMVTYGTDRLKLVNDLMTKLKDRYEKPGTSYHDLLSKYYTLFYQRFNMAGALSRYLGGVYVDRSFAGQEKNAKPYTPVPVDYQKKALNTLSTYIFAPDAFTSDTYLFPYLQRQRRGFNFFGRPENPKPEDIVLDLQGYVLDYIMYPVTMQRMNSTTLYGNTYASADVLKDVADMIFDADLKTDVNLYRQNIQTEYVKKLIATQGNSSYDYASVAASLNTIKLIKEKLKKANSPNEQTTAHRANLMFMIDKALVIK